MNITILGAGAFGSALGDVLRLNRHTVRYFDPYKFPEVTLAGALDFSGSTEVGADSMDSSTDPADSGAVASASAGAEAVILAAPSAVAVDLLPKLPADLPLICASKGFLSLAPFRRFRDFSVLSGPAFASQLEAGSAASAFAPGVITQESAVSAPGARVPITLTATSALIAELFTTPWLKFDRTDDHLGVLLCGSLKNVYAIGAGYYRLMPEEGQENEPSLERTATPTPSLEQTSAPVPPQEEKNTPILPLYHTLPKKSIPNSPQTLNSYLSTALQELKSILEANHADPATADLACGIGDLALTCSSSESRNYQYGLSLAQNSQDLTDNNTTIEGLSALSAIRETPTFKIPPDCSIITTIQTLTAQAHKPQPSEPHRP